MARLRDDEAADIRLLLGAERVAALGPRWEQKVDAIETFIALGSWRSQSIRKRAAALVDALNAGAAVEAPPIEERWDHRDT